MAFQPFHTLRNWLNLPSQKTPLNATNLNYMDNSIKEADNRIVQLDAKKAEVSLVNQLVRSVVLDPKSGVLTVTLQNGTVTTYDLDIERVVTNFDITDDNILVLTLADGSTKEVDLTKFVNTFSNTATVSMKMENRVVTAEIVDGSVTMEKLDAAIQSEFRQYMLDAQSARDSALQYQKFAKRYALGDAEFEGSETDNAKYYYEQSKSNAETTTANAEAAADSAGSATAQAAIATTKATSATASANSAAADAQIATEKATIASQMAGSATEKAQAAAHSAETATAKALAAADSAQLSQRYAVGGVVSDDAQDNSKWYCQQAENYAKVAQEVTDIIYPEIYVDLDTGHLMSIGGNNFSVSLDSNGHLISAIGSGGAA